MISTCVSTASSFDEQMMQEVLDQAIEDTCRNFGLLSPYNNDLNRGDQEVQNSEQNLKVLNTIEDLTVDEDCGITYDGMISKERAKKFPTSYYHVEEMNKGPVDYAPRLAKIPSQYQLESLTEVYMCDYPSMNKCGDIPHKGELEVDAPSTNIPPDLRTAPATTNICQVFSQYVSEMLY
ncbi:unnamed protein product [Cylicocyclus nassatus]|uniref:Uncharacterized protein n=1 Tax=Cylicocyclus nassatus TaxID=53992 RepID=A0AA36HAE1_CYLNA|nr:unnamed protein product [Cylicocyclus nassatus]